MATKAKAKKDPFSVQTGASPAKGKKTKIVVEPEDDTVRIAVDEFIHLKAKEKELEEHALNAIKDKAAVFHPFSLLPAWEGVYKDLDKDMVKMLELVSG